MQPRRKLSDILSAGSGGNWINNNWGDIVPAPEFGPIPPGKYICHLIALEPFTAGTGTPGVKLAFEVIEGDYKGRRQWYDIWLSDAARRQAVRDLGKLGIRNKEDLERPLPTNKRIRCAIVVVVRTMDNGITKNEVKSFEVIGVDDVLPDPFAPSDERGAA